MKLLYSSASPYSAKVVMAANHLGIKAELVPVDTAADPEELLRANPLGKIPTLITDDGLTLYDSRTIMHYLDSLDSEQRLYPRKPEKRAEIERMEALCDGICDALLLIVYEKRYRTPETYHQPWVDRQWEKVRRGLDYLDENPPKLGKRLNAGHFALGGLLGYLMLRFPGEWEQHRVRLARWPSAFQEAYPPFMTLKSHV
nr:glutathione S-transferase [Marinicella sp. W31]MDC2876970.1 glutathione S-transferase [Marinicella sp. W31]